MISVTGQPERNNGRSAQITLADGVLGLLLLAGGIIRWVNLGGQPLNPSEAEAAWQAWAFWQPNSALLASGSPAYLSLTRLLTPLLGFGDGIMRLGPALLGWAILLLPWLWRRRLGKVGALVTTLLLAVSPLQVIASRTANGETAALLALLLLVIAYFQFRDTGQTRWLYALAAAGGLGLNSAPLFYSGLVALLIAALIYRWIRLPLFVQAAPPVARRTRQTAVLVGIGTFVAIATLFLWNPAGLGTAVRVPAAWLAQFRTSAPLLDPYMALARYEPVLLVVGLLALVWMMWRNHPLAAFCAYWLVGGLLLMLAQPGELSHALLLTLPGSLLVGIFADAVLETGWSRFHALVTLGGLLALLLMLVNGGRLLRLIALNDLINLWIMMLALAIGMAALYFLLGWEPTAVVSGSLLALLLFLAYWQWGSAWWLGHAASNDPRERWVRVGTDDDVRALIPTITEVSRQFTRADHDVEMVSLVDSPVLRWYLRDFQQLQFVDTLPVESNHAVIISPLAMQALRAGSDYMGGDFGLLRQEPPAAAASDSPLLDTLRWWLFHESTAVVPQERVILWLRADLAQGNK